MVGEAGEDVLEHANSIEHLDAQLHRITPRAGLHRGVPAHRQAPFGRHLAQVGAVLAMDGDAVVAQGHRPQDRLPGQGGTAPPESIVEAFEAQDCTGARRRRRLEIGMGSVS